MTRNNLTEHLSWLLDSKLSIPPTTNALPPVSISFTQAEPTQAANDIDQPEETADNNIPELTNVNTATAAQEDMARLRAEVGSARKPSLVSMGPRLDSTSHNAEASIAETPSHRRTKTTVQAPKPTPYSTAQAVPASPELDVEVMDLTETRAHQRSPTTSRVAGRKRKSSEMERDSPPAAGRLWSPKRSAQAMPPPPGGSQQSFTAIDEIMMDAPTEPPPPYSTIAPGRVSPVRMPPVRLSPVRVSPARRTTYETAATSRSSTTFGAEGSPVMPDSEGDEDDLVDFNRDRSRTPAFRKRILTTQKPTLDTDVAKSQSKQAPLVRTEQDVESALRKTFRADAKEPAPSGDGGIETPTNQLRATAPEREQSEDQRLVEQFFGLSKDEIQEYCNNLLEASERLLEELSACLENEQEPGDLQKRWDDADACGQSFQSLGQKKSEYDALQDELNQARLAMRAAVRARAGGVSEAKAAIDACKTKLQVLVNEGCELMGRCRQEVSDLLQHAANGGNGSRKVAVESTQAPPPNAKDKQPYVPSSSRIAQTQTGGIGRMAAQLPQTGENATSHRRDSPPNIEEYFSPSRKKRVPYSKHDNQPRSRSHPKLNDIDENDDDDDDEFGDIDESELAEAGTRMFSNRMSPPPAPFEDEEDFGDVDMLDFAEDYENQDVPQPPARNSAPRVPLAQTSGNSQLKPVHRTPKKKKRSPAKTDDLSYERLFRHPWSDDVKETLKARFRLKGFRENQVEAINATLAGKDVFVLMPTGGGKSLCYQLPSLVNSGKTLGVTIVISPLLSLMDDQVQHMRKLGIQAFLINSETPQHKREAIMGSMQEPAVEEYVQLLYVTPEMLSKSQRMIDAFERLYRRQKLARLVIDEAHCVSQWGHDFRPDYKLIGDVRRRFPKVPVMALTATATENVKLDTVHNLGIDGCEIFTSSFNRPNLYYEVRQKPRAKEDVKQIAKLIKEKYSRKTGIIYCLSRKACETMAKALAEEYNIKAHHYHAGLDPELKGKILKNWQAGVHHVVVATIAFGMGIDKPDVRFVIHHTLPKSLEGYYQETGRAGRDTLSSGCYLFYGYQDVSKLRRMIDEGDGDYQQRERQHQMLRKMSQYCDNKSDCRRVQVLRYFNEDFDQSECEGGCDNCQSTSNFETVDFTDHAQQAVSLIEEVAEQKVTLLQCMDIFRGATTKKITDNQHNELDAYGAGRDLDRGDIERLFYHLLTERAILEENVVHKKTGFAHQYVLAGPRAAEFSSGRRQLQMKVPMKASSDGQEKVKAPPKKKAKKNQPKDQAMVGRKTARSRAPAELPMSTNISSPIQAVHGRLNHNSNAGGMHGNGYRRDNFVVSDEEDGDCAESDDDDSDGFGPIRKADQPPRESVRRPGGPIKADKTMDSLDDVHRDLVEQFVQDGRKAAQKLMIQKDLRITPFSDSMLRTMAINWTETEEQMLRIRDISPDNVRLYGKRFCKLVKQYHGYYDEAMQTHLQPDPNAQNVIDLVSDDEEEDDDEYGGFSMDEEDLEPSGYFQPLAPSAKVAEFNQRVYEAESAGRGGGAGSSKPKKAAKGGKKRAYKATGSTAAPRRNGFAGGPSRFNSYSYDGGEGSTSGGAGKRKGGGKRSGGGGGKSGGGNGGRSAPKNGGNAKQSFIGMMPT